MFVGSLGPIANGRTWKFSVLETKSVCVKAIVYGNSSWMVKIGCD